MNPIIVIGGGVAGLMAAAHLAARGMQVQVLEADPAYAGGRLKGGPSLEFAYAGRSWTFPSEHGVHGIWSSYRNLLAGLERFGIRPDLAPSDEETWMFLRGGVVRAAPIGSAIRRSPFPAPFHYLAMFLRPGLWGMLSPGDLLRLPLLTGDLFAALAFDPWAEQHDLGGMSLAEYTRRWPPNLRSLFAGLARNALSAAPEHVPASGFFVFLRFYTLLRRDAWAFSYVRGTGADQIVEPLLAAARNHGVDVRLGARVLCLQQEPGTENQEPGGWSKPVSDTLRWRVEVEHSTMHEVLCADHVILALDAPATAQVLRHSPALAEAARLRFSEAVPTAIVRLWFDATPRRWAVSGILTGDCTADNFFRLDLLQPQYADWHAAGGSALELHVYGPPEVVAHPDATLLALVITDVGRAFPELRGRLVHGCVQRNPATHTLLYVGRAGEHLGIQTPWPGLHACGDWVAHPHPAMYLERAATTGILAANAVLEQHGLESWPVLEHPAPERLAGWMQAGLRMVRTRNRRTKN